MTALADASRFGGAAACACNHCDRDRPPNIESPPTRNSSRRVVPSHVLDGRPRIRNIDMVLQATLSRLATLGGPNSTLGPGYPLGGTGSMIFPPVKPPDRLVQRMRKEYPQYAALQYPRPCSLQQARDCLHANEVAVLFALDDKQ